MKIKRDRFYLYIGYKTTETKWTWDFQCTRPGYLWLLVDIGILWRKLMLTLRIGKGRIVRKQGVHGDSSGKSSRYSHKPVTFDSDDWAEWEL